MRVYIGLVSLIVGRFMRVYLGKGDRRIEVEITNQKQTQTYNLGLDYGNKEFLVQPYKKENSLIQSAF